MMKFGNATYTTNVHLYHLNQPTGELGMASMDSELIFCLFRQFLRLLRLKVNFDSLLGFSGF